jgi:hypothetical protein
VSSNHPAAGARGAAVRPAVPRDRGARLTASDGQGAVPQVPSSETPSDAAAGTTLRLQVLEIIDSLLNSAGPELEEHRARLRGHLSRHPWDPETALLRYLWDREQQGVTSAVLPGAGP